MANIGTQAWIITNTCDISANLDQYDKLGAKGHLGYTLQRPYNQFVDSIVFFLV